jgi:hypothetical protein
MLHARKKSMRTQKLTSLSWSQIVLIAYETVSHVSTEFNREANGENNCKQTNIHNKHAFLTCYHRDWIQLDTPQ